jgi:hypothetical protein
MNFIPAYTDHGGKINPAFAERTLLMLAEHFGYDYEELEEELDNYPPSMCEDWDDTERFTSFLFCAIEGDLSCTPKEA